MIKYDIVTKYYREHLFFWKPNTSIGFLLRVLVLLTLLTIYILLFCLREDSEIPVVHTGDVQILLKWKDTNDLDLSCVDPYLDKVCYSQKTVESGGQLDVDNNAQLPYSRTPVENIYWPVGEAPSGKYSVYLTFYKSNESTSSDYEIVVKYNGITQQYSGTIMENQKDMLICSFVIEK